MRGNSGNADATKGRRGQLATLDGQTMRAMDFTVPGIIVHEPAVSNGLGGVMRGHTANLSAQMTPLSVAERMRPSHRGP